MPECIAEQFMPSKGEECKYLPGHEKITEPEGRKGNGDMKDYDGGAVLLDGTL